jgi:hypothetical protein
MKNHRLELDSEIENEKYKDFSDALRILYAGIAGIKYKSPRAKEEEKIEKKNEYVYSFDNHDGWMN